MPIRDTFTSTVEDAGQYEADMRDIADAYPDYDPAAQAEADADAFETDLRHIGYDAYAAQYGEPHIDNPSHPF